MEFIVDFFNNCIAYFKELGEIGLFILSFLESSVFPIPPDFLLIPMCLTKPQNALFLAAICTIGSAIGGIAGYFIGKFGGRPVLNFLFKKHLDKVEMVEVLYNKYGVWAVGAAAFTPIPYKIFTIASGVFRMNFLGFFIISVIGRGMRFFIVAALLMLFGEKIKANLEPIIIIVSVLIILFYFIAYKLRHLAKK